MSSPVNMRDIAARAGVSIATVSMSLRNRPNISPELRRRIRALARRMGYEPNPYVSALMRERRKGRTQTSRPVLALISGLDQPDAWKNSSSPTRRAIREGLIERGARLGYDVQEYWLHPDGLSVEQFSEDAAKLGISGVVIGPLAEGAPPPPLRWQDFATISISVPLQTLPLRTVSNDNYFTSLRAVSECHRLGYRRPGLVLRSVHRQRFQGRWEAGFTTAQALLPELARLRPFLIEDQEDIAHFPLKRFKAWLAREKPDVIVTMAADLIERVLTAEELKVPDDIGIAALSCPAKGHRHSGVYQNGHFIGTTAVDLLVGMIERRETGLPEQAIATMVEGVWNPGTTLRPQHPVAKEHDAPLLATR
jgi:DNA-binding LacI/PurR family transcriptional regulator